MSGVVHAISGGLGGAAALIVTYPLVAVSCNQQTNKKNIDKLVLEAKKEAEAQIEKSEPKETEEAEKPEQQTHPTTALEAAKDIYHKYGVSGFYAGMESAIYGMALTNFVYYYFYETTGRIFVKNRKVKRLQDVSLRGLKHVVLQNLSAKESIVTGLLAGSITAIATNPFWVVNTRSTVNKTNKSLFKLLVEVYQNEGFKALFNGLLPALVLVINPIIQYSIFEQIKNIIAKKGRFKPVHAFFIGALAKLAATGVTYPYITVKSRMHLKKKNEPMTRVLMGILKNEGLGGLYNGIFVKLSQSILTAAFLFFFKEELVGVVAKMLRAGNGKKK